MNRRITIGKTGHQVIPFEESIKKAQKKVKKYLQSDSDLVDMLFQDRKEEVENEQ